MGTHARSYKHHKPTFVSVRPCAGLRTETDVENIWARGCLGKTGPHLESWPLPLRPWLCVKAFTTLRLHLVHNMPVFTSRTWVSWGRGRRHIYLSGSIWCLVDAQWILEKRMNEWGERYRIENTRTKFPIIRQMLQQLRLRFYTETEICWGKRATQMWRYVPLPGKITLATLKKKTTLKRNIKNCDKHV